MNTFQKDIQKIFDGMAYEHPRYEIISDFFEMSAIAIRNAVSHDSQRAEYEKRYADVAKKYNETSTIGQLVTFLNLCGLQSFTSTLKM